MYCLRLFESTLDADKKTKDVIALDFPKNKNNFLFKVNISKDELKITLEDESSDDVAQIKLKVLDDTEKIFSKFLTETFADKEAEIICLFDGKKYYIVDIFFNKRWFVQEDIDEFGQKYNFNTLKTIYKGDFDEEKIKALNKSVLIKSRLENDFFTTTYDKERYVIFSEVK